MKKNSLSWLLALSFVFPACVPSEDLVEGEEIWDEGPTADEASSDEAFAFYEPIALPPVFQLPFPCDQVWSGQTRTNHSPVNSVDFNRTNDFGDTVTASAGGTVTRVENLGNTSYGKWIEISHGSGFTTRYAHLSEQYVSVGQVVRKGQEIGAVGNTGGSTGAHLHYEQRSNGSSIKAKFNNAEALYFGTKNYTSKNCNAGAPGTINTSGASVNVRSGAGTNFSIVGTVADGAHVTITCQKRGQSVTGTYGTSDIWDFIGNGYVADTFVNTGSNGLVAPLCP
jgi:hypothetical protein